MLVGVANVDCYTGWGYDYKGTFNSTRTGRVCAEWAAAKVRGCVLVTEIS